MNSIIKISLSLCLVILTALSGASRLSAQTVPQNNEPYRPQVHFSPAKSWMNDPNGLVLYKGTYHLFYQFYPGGTQWGPMHWGHATSKDLFHWQQQPIALYPDSLGYIFSGSVVVDSNNTSRLGKDRKIPLVAIFTHHDPKLERKGSPAQSQSLAYSLDEGKTWQKYTRNPVLPNPGISDFRDPKVSWYEKGKVWMMTLATKDRVTFYSSPDLIKWTKESDFGAATGAHGGVWECPDLFPLTWNGKKHWVLLVSINPGGPNGGSATQYFLGEFDGHRFVASDTTTRWIDYGADNYAGVTFANTGNRRLFIGWMSNWLYAGNVPSEAWRGATTVARELKLEGNGKKPVLTSHPVSELVTLAVSASQTKLGKKLIRGQIELGKQQFTAPFKLSLSGSSLRDFSVTLKNSGGDKFVFGYESATKRYYTDRSQSGKTAFHKDFGQIHFAPRISISKTWQAELIIDAASVEIFADRGMTNFTEICFPSDPFNSVVIASKNIVLNQVILTPLQATTRK